MAHKLAVCGMVAKTKAGLIEWGREGEERRERERESRRGSSWS